MLKPIKLFVGKKFSEESKHKNGVLPKAAGRKWEAGVEKPMQMYFELPILTIIMSTYMINENIYPHNPLQRVNI